MPGLSSGQHSKEHGNDSGNPACTLIPYPWSQYKLNGSYQPMELPGVTCLGEENTVHLSERASPTVPPPQMDKLRTGGRNWQGSLGIGALKVKSFIIILGQK